MAATDELTVTSIGIDYRTNTINLIRDLSLIQLKWRFLSYFKDVNGIIKQNEILVNDASQYPEVYIGYYARYIELLPSTASAGNFRSSFKWGFDSTINKFSIKSDQYVALTGTASS